MTTTIDNRAEGAWYPRLLGAVALALLLMNLADLLITPRASAEQLLFGTMFFGPAAQAATVVHILFFAWLSWGCFTRRPIMVWVTIGYCVYLALSMWVWTARYGNQFAEAPLGALLINAVVTLCLLAVCRATFTRRQSFVR